MDEGSAAFSAWDGLLYTADGTTLVAVPAGATEITIREGCVVLAPGALAGCAKLERIDAPTTVVAISPDVLEGEAVTEGAAEGLGRAVPDTIDAAGEDDGDRPSQLASLVALTAISGSLPSADPAFVSVTLPEGAERSPWEAIGFAVSATPSASGPSGADDEAGSPSADGLSPAEGAVASDADADLSSAMPIDSLVSGGASTNEEGDSDAGAVPEVGLRSATSEVPALIAVNEVTRSHGYAHTSDYERSTPMVSAVLRLQLVSDEASDSPTDASGGAAPAEEALASSSEGSDSAALSAGVSTLSSTLSATFAEDALATGSFVYEGCTYVIESEEGCAALVAVDPARLAAISDDPTTLVLPECVSDGQRAYRLTRVGAGSLAGSGVQRLWLPASATYLDDALVGCETLRYVAVDEANPSYSSYGGALYDKGLSTLWMAPEGIEHLELPATAQGMNGPEVIARCTRLAVLAVSDENPNLSSEGGAIFTEDGSTLLRVAPGAEAATLPEGCVAVASGALNGCDQLETLYVEGDVASVSPEAFDAKGAGSFAKATSAVKGRTAQGTDAASPAQAASARADVDSGFETLQVALAEGADPAAWEAVGAEEVKGSSLPETSFDSTAPASSVEIESDEGQLQAQRMRLAEAPRSVEEEIAVAAEEDRNYAYVYYDSMHDTAVLNLYSTDRECKGQDQYHGIWASAHMVNPYQNHAPFVYYPKTYYPSVVVYETSNGAYQYFHVGVEDSDTTNWEWSYDITRVSASPTGPALPALSAPISLYMHCRDDVVISEATITWDANGGSVSPTSSTGTPGGSLTAPTPSRTGYGFDGWYTAATGGTRVAGAGESFTVPDADATYYARWSPVTYNVRYFDHAGNWKATDQKAYGDTFSLRGDPGWTASGYAAQGWATAKGQAAKAYSFGQSVSNLATAQGANVDLYVAEAARSFSVTLERNGGSGGSASSTATFGSAMRPIYVPSRTGYAFQGYFDVSEASGGTQYYASDGTSARSWDKASNATLWARWSPVAYNVRYFDHAGNWKATDQKAYGDTFSLRGDPGWTASGYAAQGWATAKGQAAKAYSFGQSVSNLATVQGANVDLYLAETANTYTINYHSRSGTYLGSQSAAYDQGLTLWGAAGASAGYTANGWATAPWQSSGSYGLGSWASNLATGGTVDLYLAESPNPYTIRYHDHAGNHLGDQGATYDQALALWGDPDRTAAGYTAQGWARSANQAAGAYAFGQSVSNLATGGTVDLYLAEAANAYNVRYFTKDGAHIGTDQKAYGEAFSLRADPGRTGTGYTAQGWARSANQTAAAYSFGQSVSNLATAQGANVDLFVAETANVYNVRYFTKSGEHIGTDAKAYGDTFSLRADPGRTPVGYTAQGWARSKGQTGKAYSFGQSVSNLATAQGANVDLFVAETANTYNVRYFDKAGNHIGTDQKSYDAWFNLRGDPGRTHPAYTAKGWATARNQTAASHAFALWTRNLASAQGANFDLYVAETANAYSISYDAAGGKLSGQRTSYTFETADFRLAEPTRTGYTFTGWKVTGAAEGSAGVAQSGASSTVRQGTWGNLSCVATWRANEYAVALDASFPEFATSSDYEGYAPYGVSKDAGTASVTATFDSAMPAATMPRATGYRFEGYFDDAGTCYYGADGSSARAWDKPGDVTLHGRWTVERHELTLDVGNGEVPSAAGRGWVRDEGDAGLYRLSYSIEWVEESGGSLRIQLPAPAERHGYADFEGWVGGGIGKPSLRVQVQPWELADRAYTGVFSGVIQYAASLDLAGGSFAKAPEGWFEANGSWTRSFTVESDAFSLPTPERHGYGFEGWAAVAADGSLGEPAKDVTVPKGSWGDRAWRATWKAVSYRISYDLAGGAMSGQRESYTMEDPDFDLPVPAREGYSFQGWEVEGANGAGLSQSGVVTTVRQGTWGDLHATAKWATASYSVALSLEGGSFATAPEGWSEAGGSWTRAFTVESEAFSLPTPARPGHDFLGWALVQSDGSLGSPAASVTVPKGTVGDRSYRALWQARTYAVTWHYSGQVIDGRQSVTTDQAYGSPIAFPSRPSVADPAREHYSFEGWFTAQEGGERVQAGDYLLESDATFYARWSPVEYVVHLHLGDDDAYGEHKAAIEQGGAALPMAPDGHFDLPYTVEDEVVLPTVTDDPEALKPVREGMSFMGWVECAEDGSFDADLVPSMLVTLPKGSHGDRHYRALWSFALRFEVPSAVSFRFDLADDEAFEDAPYGPVKAVSGDGVQLRSLSLGRLAVADVALDVAGARPDDIVTDRSKVSLRVMDASLSEPWTGWVGLPTTAAPERLDPFDLEPLGFGEGNALAPLSSKPLRYEIEVQDPTTTLAGEVSSLPLAKVVFTVKGLW